MGNGFDEICTDTKVIVLWYPLVGKVYTSAELKTIRIAVPTVLGELRFGHMTRFSWRDGVGVSCFEKCPVAMQCAMADEESSSNLKLGSCVDQPHSVTKELL